MLSLTNSWHMMRHHLSTKEISWNKKTKKPSSKWKTLHSKFLQLLSLKRI